MSVLTVDSLDFELPTALEATEPAEVRGRGRDDVRLLVARRRDLHLTHARFWQLPEMLEPGDLVVINTSATLPAAVATLGGLEIHFSTSLPAGLWLVELREPRGPASAPFAGGTPGERLHLRGGAEIELLAPWAGGYRLWVANVDLPAGHDLTAYLQAEGHPIRYSYVTRPWPLEAYQTNTKIVVAASDCTPACPHRRPTRCRTPSPTACHPPPPPSSTTPTSKGTT